MQVVLRGIAVLMIGAGVSLCLLWFVGPIVEAILRDRSRSGPSFGFTLSNTSGVLSLGLCLAVPGFLLLPAAGWLSRTWVPMKSLRLCAKCGYPRDDMTREKCPDCGERLFAPAAHHGRNAQRVTGETI
jgi:hypothetical protein